ncbi:hypothetical protein PENTCL1PPCAC_1516, partial [Pristionchus entomophagus]
MSAYEDVDGRRVEIKAIGNGEKKRQIHHSISLPVLSPVPPLPPRDSAPRSPLTLTPDRSRESGRHGDSLVASSISISSSATTTTAMATIGGIGRISLRATRSSNCRVPTRGET